MGKRKGEWLSFMALLLVFMLTTLFFYMVYTMHYRIPHPMILPVYRVRVIVSMDPPPVPEIT